MAEPEHEAPLEAVETPDTPTKPDAPKKRERAKQPKKPARKTHKTAHASPAAKTQSLNVAAVPKSPAATPAWERPVLMGLSALLVLVLLYNVIAVTGISSVLRPKIAEALEAAKPSHIELVSVVDSGCTDCFDISDAVTALKSANVQVESEQSVAFDSEQGKALISQYSIARIPTLIVTGETDRLETDFEQQGDALVFSAPQAPYTDPQTGERKGLVQLILIENRACVKCFSLLGMSTQLSQLVKVTGLTRLDYRDAQDVIGQYGISKLPAMVISSAIGEYPAVAPQLAATPGTRKLEDGSYVVQSPNPPFFDIETQSVLGLVKLTLLDDKSCESCYNVSLHKRVLPSFGVQVGEEELVDISSSKGKALLAQYNITAVPTILLDKEAQRYPTLMAIWSQVGAAAEDGTLVFTRASSMGAYKDLSTGDIIGG